MWFGANRLRYVKHGSLSCKNDNTPSAGVKPLSRENKVREIAYF